MANAFSRYGPLMLLAAMIPAEPSAAQAGTIKRLDGTSITIAEADAFARATLAAAHVTGAQIAVVNDGRVVWSAAFGLRRREPELPMTPATTTWAASITKSVFATYVMQLVERGEFSLDIPVAKQLGKPLDEIDAWKESASELVKDPRWPSVTPRMLLAHTGGLRNFASLEPDQKMHIHSDPGSVYSYSGDGLNLVQLAIEQQKHKNLDTLMQNAIFTPLGMTGTGMIYRTEFAPNVADRYGAEEQFLAQTKRYPARASGNMMSNVDDLARFAAALLNDRIISAASRQAMLKPYIQIRSRHQFNSAAEEPDGKEADNVGLAYGVGWGLLTRTPFGPAFFKEGHGDGAQNYMICFERQRSCMIILTNSDNGELAFRPLMENILGNTVTPWEWEGYNGPSKP